MAETTTRLNAQQWQQAQAKAQRFRAQLIALSHKNNPHNFYLVLFAIAASRIQADTDAFCGFAEQVFEEIEAYGQEPTLDESWMAELTGDKDTFYFSTQSLVTQPIPLPRQQRQKPLPLPDRTVNGDRRYTGGAVR
ncbi:hypothetical protein S7335_1309 [Synechococcus sp. PCC 7335]|uniref:hypothetical protein n=1 Tax=Synechococcus sp. (strain ATCC 29403 / PCC 7335) TaxID=91464 RepID=UPI00017EE130|nr:hypothetical protein [Synechococcus sp. PCC 7335]EDX82593.1 hypothetical protein S7335_1297 [Synechococcus sp. PCC 7335]EDX82605.1 hypothetical protein S7335_1309 [Synechococcus sp. PCC 7335]